MITDGNHRSHMQLSVILINESEFSLSQITGSSAESNQSLGLLNSVGISTNSLDLTLRRTPTRFKLWSTAPGIPIKQSKYQDFEAILLFHNAFEEQRLPSIKRSVERLKASNKNTNTIIVVVGVASSPFNCNAGLTSLQELAISLGASYFELYLKEGEDAKT